MKNGQIVKILLISVIMLLINSCGPSSSTIKEEKIITASKMPKWVVRKPVDNEAYIGIGYSPKEYGSIEHIQKATNSALSMIASEIKVNISSDVINSLIEKGEIVENEFREDIQAKTQMNLEGYELVDNWEDESNFYVFYRLSKQKYEYIINNRKNEAIQLALENKTDAEINIERNNYTSAVKYYIKSLEAIETYLSESLITTIDGKDVYLGNYLFNKLQKLFEQIVIKARIKNIEGKLGYPVYDAIFTVKTKSGIPVENYPLKFSFIKGEADFIPNGKSDMNGKSKVSIAKIKSAEKLQIVEAEYDFSKYTNTNSIILNKLLNTLVVSSDRITINVKKPIIYIESEEKINDKDINILRIEPVIKEYFSGIGFEFIDFPLNNDWIIKVNVNARYGSKVQSLHTSFADLTFSVIDISTGNEIYKTNLNHVKGIDLSYKKAGYKALENIATQVKEKIIPELLETIK